MAFVDTIKDISIEVYNPPNKDVEYAAYWSDINIYQGSALPRNLTDYAPEEETPPNNSTQLLQQPPPPINAKLGAVDGEADALKFSWELVGHSVTSSATIANCTAELTDGDYQPLSPQRKAVVSVSGNIDAQGRLEVVFRGLENGSYGAMVYCTSTSDSTTAQSLNGIRVDASPPPSPSPSPSPLPSPSPSPPRSPYSYEYYEYSSDFPSETENEERDYNMLQYDYSYEQPTNQPRPSPSPQPTLSPSAEQVENRPPNSPSPSPSPSPTPSPSPSSSVSPSPSLSCNNYVGAYRIRSVFCDRRYLSAALNCSDSIVRLRSTHQALLPRTIWRLNAKPNTFTNIRSSRECDRTILASNARPSLGSGTATWQFQVTPRAVCSRVTLKAKSGQAVGKYLGVRSDCNGLYWRSRGNSKYATWDLVKD
jgi:hypothetical protein